MLSAVCVGERKAAAGVSGGRMALVAGALCAGRAAPRPPVAGAGLAVRGGRADPSGGLAVCPRPDWPSPDCPRPVCPRGGRVAAPDRPFAAWPSPDCPSPDCPRGGRVAAGAAGLVAPPAGGVRNAEPVMPAPCVGLAGAGAVVRNGEAGAGATGLATGAAGAAPGVGVTPSRGRCSAGVAALPADEPLPLFWAEPSGLFGNNVGG